MFSFISGGSVAIDVNGEISPFFQTQKGLHQGDRLLSILFNIIAEVLAILINRAKAKGQIGGVVHHLVDGSLSILQDVHDTILFMEHNLEKPQNMKLLFFAFEKFVNTKN